MTQETILIFILGFLSQGLFASRVLVQWIMSEKAGKIVNPTIFWALSLAASYIFFIYGWLRHDFALMLGQIIGYYVYIWNLGKKRVWEVFPKALRIAVLTILIVTPAVCIGLLFDDPAAVIDKLFEDKDIPMWLIVLGSLGQIVFSFRFLYQMIYSSRKGESVLPIGFWILSVTGSILIITYGFLRLDPVVIIGHACGLVSYTRQMILWQKNKLS